MGIGENVMFAISIVVILALVVGVLQFLVPVNTYAEFQRICGAYQDLADRQGGLTGRQLGELRARLQAFGMESVTVSASEPSSVAYGEDVQLSVAGQVAFRRLSWLEWHEESLPLSYNWQAENRKLVNE